MGSKYKSVKVPEPVLKERRSSRHSVNTSRKSDKDVSLEKIPKSLGKYSESCNVILKAYKEAKSKQRLSTNPSQRNLKHQEA